MTTSVVKNLLIKAAQTKQGSDAMHFTQAAINAAQALNIMQMIDDVCSETIQQTPHRGYGNASGGGYSVETAVNNVGYGSDVAGGLRSDSVNYR